MARADLLRFRESMNIGYEEWHDGVGYDLEALGRLSADERTQAEQLLIARQASDWRDLEALDALGSEAALAAIEEALGAAKLEVRMGAAQALIQRQRLAPAAIDAVIVTALGETTILNGMVRTLRLAEAHPTEAVRRQLLRCARDGNDDVRVHAAALVHFLYGKSAESFDWSHRPFYLRFGQEPGPAREAAFRELCVAIGVDPGSI